MFMAARFHLLFPIHLHSPFHLQALLMKAWAVLTHGSFAQAFWPTTAATLVSLIVGLPVALALNRAWLSYTSRPERAEERPGRQSCAVDEKAHKRLTSNVCPLPTQRATMEAGGEPPCTC
jgi:hypothetical protein